MTFSVGTVLGTSFGIWFKNLIPFTLLAAAVHFPLIVYTYFAMSRLEAGDFQHNWLIWSSVNTVASLVLNNIVSGAIIYGVVQEWVKAMNERNAAGVLAQVAPDYFDDAGTPEPGDDLDRERLEKAIAADLARIEGSKLAVTLRRIEVQNETAFAEIFYDSYYRVQTTVGPVPRRDSDVHRMRFRKLDGKWKIAGGL